ncbi:MAG: leucine-rich repeat domain-containing protein, partial [Clostridia bacterium]|nr:leucine-rich repeat domain-containing protein [Clostridia bacterium]
EPFLWYKKWNYYIRPVVWNSANSDHGVTDSGMQWCMTDEGTIAISGYGGSLSKVEIPSEINGRSVTSILESAFIERKDIISIDIPASVAYVGKNAFKYCGKMAIYCQVSEKPAGWDVEWNPSRQRVIWNNSPNDHDVTHDGIQWRLTDEGTVEIMGYSADAFQFKIPSTIDGKVVSAISADAFDDCDRLTRVEIPIGITKIGSGVFDGCMSLIIYCEAESKQIGWEYNWRSGRPVVWNCKYNDVADDGNVYLTADNGMNYTLDNGKATLVSVFKAISGDVVIPASVVYKDVEYKVTGIGDETFRNIKSVTSVKISNGIESIGESAFSNCDNLFSVEIPNSMISIGSHAFAFCSELRNIWIPKSVEYMGESVFQRFGNDYILCAYCEAESKPIGWDEKWSVRYYDQWMGRYSYNSYVFGSTGIGIY